MSPTKKLFAAIVIALSCAAVTAQADPPKREHMKTVQTPISRTELLHVLRDGHLRVFGKYPSKNRLAMAWGQVAFENGSGKFSYNHNLGFVGPSAPDQPTFRMGDNHWYRAFTSHDDAAVAYWEVIKRCSPALARFDVGNPGEAAIWLKRCGYFEATLEQYTPGFSTLYYTAIKTIIPEDEREQERQHQELLAAIRRSIAQAGPAPTPAPIDPNFLDAALRDGD